MRRPRRLLPLATALLACAAPRPPSAAPPAEGPAEPAAAPSPPSPPATPPGDPGIDPSILDRAVDPCQDFYAFACGGWLARTEVPPDRSRWVRSFDVMRERNELRLKELLEEAARGGPAADPSERMAGDLYAGCMDDGRIERNGLSDLRAEWRALEGVQDAASFSSAVGRLHRRALFPLFRLGSRQDARDSSQVIGQVAQGGLSLPDRDYYLKDDPRSAALRADFLAHLERALTLAGVPAAQAAEEAQAVLEVETELARSHWTRTEQRDPARVYNRLELAGLREAAPRFDWDRYLSAAGAAGVTAFSTTTPAMLTVLDRLLSRTSPERLRAYLRWQVLSEAAADWALPRSLSEEAFWFRAHHFTGETTLPPRWRTCVDQVDDLLGEALGRLYVRRFFGDPAREKAAALFAGVEEALGRSIASREWMDDATRARAREKLAALGGKVGYPRRWRSYAGLVVRRNDYYGAVRNARALEERRQLAKIGRPPERDEWGMSAPTVNAYYSPSLNEIVVPAGILQPPFFTPGANDAVNYGAIGLVIGHELSHGFDDSGRRFDAGGNLAEWWTEAVAGEFERRAACIADEYSSFVAVDDLKLNGRLTLGENIADLGGLSLAWSAYQASRAGKPGEAEVAGFSPAQQFFLAHAQAWCERIRPENARLRVVTDPHSPGRWRVNGPLSSFPAFQEAFACRSGDLMVREERCEIW
ncbi:MAG TPA: M13 family metallopeptidase [Anaeromyxobacter sp.]|nr:M13 family metallopeptidase [Anaeromyxobacter sp.]